MNGFIFRFFVFFMPQITCLAPACCCCVLKACLSAWLLTCIAWEENTELWLLSSTNTLFVYIFSNTSSCALLMAQIGSCLLLCISVFVQRRMSAEVNPSLVNWLTSMMSMRLHIILEHNPVTEDQIQHYIIHLQVINKNSLEQIFLSFIQLLLKPHYLCR